MSRATRVIPSLAATLLATAAAWGPGIPRQEPLVDVLMVIDITRSMNVRDMGGQSRLDYAKAALRDWVAARPCGTRIGLALFSERRSLTLFEPVEVCADFASLSRSLEALDWRMAWEGDSLISRGLDHALGRARDMDVALILVTDGHEAPPLPYGGPAAFQGDSPGGLILGVGGDVPAPIPRFDDYGRETGFYESHEVQHAPARIGAPPPDAAERPGFHPRNNPYGESDLEGAEHLSALRADYLRDLAAERGLGFARVDDGNAAIDRELGANAPSRSAIVTRSLAPLLALVALLIIAGCWLLATPVPKNMRKED